MLMFLIVLIKKILMLQFGNSGSLKSHIVIASCNEITAWQSSNYEKRQCKNVFRLPETFAVIARFDEIKSKQSPKNPQGFLG